MTAVPFPSLCLLASMAYLSLIAMVAGGRRIGGATTTTTATATPLKMPWEKGEQGDPDDAVGTRWAVLVAGSNGYYNYRHQVGSAKSSLSCLFSSEWVCSMAPFQAEPGICARRVLGLVFFLYLCRPMSAMLTSC